MYYKKILVILAGAALLAVIFPPWGKNQATQEGKSASANIEEISDYAKPAAAEPLIAANAPALDLEAKSVLAIDLNSGIDLYAKNIQERLPIASLTKVMTAMVVADKVNKDVVVTVQDSDVNVVGSKMGLLSGEKITIEGLLYGMLIPSGNDAAEALARFVGGSPENFAAMMNAKASALGLNDTHFTNPVGYDSPEHFSTSYDLSKMTKEFLKYALLAKISDTKSMVVYSTDGKISHDLKTSNKLLAENPDVVGVKTGYTSEAQGNLILKLKHNGSEILTIVLNTPQREADSQKLIDWIYQVYKW